MLDLDILLGEFQTKIHRLDKLIAREIAFPQADNKIKVATGMRRSGKTYTIFQTIKQLLAKDIPLSSILYLNFEDDRLLPLDQHKLAALVDAFYARYPENHQRTCYLFFDEIQNVEEWALVVRRLHDTKRAQIYLTGSSAKLLSKEIATSLRGRSLATEVWPLSFREYLTAQKLDVDTSIFGQQAYDVLRQEFTQYLNHGGFPEIIDYDSDTRLHTLQDYVDVAIYRDIVERYEVKQTVLIKYLISFMLTNVSRPFSINRFYNDVKSQGYKVTKETLYHYVDYIEDAYLAFTVKLYDKSIRRVQTNPKKIFVVDPGLAQAFSLVPSANIGKLFENVIYLDLRRQRCKLYYYLTQDRYEVDFLAEASNGQRKLIQVCWDLSDPNTKAREQRALAAAKKELHIDGEIVTLASYLKHGISL